MDEVIYIEVLGRHGEVISRHAARALPVRIGRAYDNDLILDDPFVAPHHVVVERSAAGDLEIVDAGSTNGLFRVGARDRLIRERIDPAARYRGGRTEFRIRPSSYPVPAELVDRRGSGHSRPAAACVAVVAAAAALLLWGWSETHEPIELAKLAMPPLVLVLGLLVWAGAWALAGRVLLGEPRFATHLGVAALTVLGYLLAGNWDYLAFAFSAPGLRHLMIPATVALLAWGLWRHLSLVTRRPGRGVALAAVAVAVALVGSLLLALHVDAAGDLSKMAYLKAIKSPAVRLAEGREARAVLSGCAWAQAGVGAAEGTMIDRPRLASRLEREARRSEKSCVIIAKRRQGRGTGLAGALSAVGRRASGMGSGLQPDQPLRGDIEWHG